MSAVPGGLPQPGSPEGLRLTARLTVRTALEGDLTPLSFFFDAILRRDYFLRRGQLREILSGRRHKAFVAEIEGVLVGVAILTAGARLINVLVHPAYRGLGIGRALLACSGATEVRAKRDMSTGDPRGFYRALGFVETGGLVGSREQIELMRRASTETDSPARIEGGAQPGSLGAGPGEAATRPRIGRKRGNGRGIA
jgi:GNAT superfamily N-acetyltransferase